MDPGLLAITPTTCSGCSSPVTPGYKTCASCRAKRNEAQKRAAERKKQQRISDLRASLGMKAGTEGSTTQKVTDNGVVKRKRDEKGEDESTAMTPKTKKKRVSKMLKTFDVTGAHNVKVIPAESSGKDPLSFGTEFQTGSELYKRLKKLSRKDQLLNYKGCHSIVADPSFDHAKRAVLVARDVRKIAGLPFNHKVTRAPPTSSRTFHTLRFQCKCSKTAAAAATSGKAKKNSLSSWVTSSQGASSSDNTHSCNGEVEVTVMDDTRHPLGLMGQQIRVRVHH